jgi:type IV secretion system protein VirB10
MKLIAAVAVLAAASAAIGQEQPAVASGSSMPQDTTVRESRSGRTGELVVPAGTRVPVILKNSVSTKNARVGDSVYAQTNFPVAINNRMLIPAGTYVQGRISNIKRAGRVKGRAEVLFHFTTLVFPSGYTVNLPGAVDKADTETARTVDPEGTIRREGEKGRDIGTIASTGATGAVIGGATAGGKGAGIGAGVGGATGLLISMLSRGSDVRLEPGTTIEMVLQRDLVLDASRVR